MLSFEGVVVMSLKVFIPPMLTGMSTGSDPSIGDGGSGGFIAQSISSGTMTVELPDGTVVQADEFGNIIG